MYLENYRTYLIYYQGLNFCCFIQKKKVFQSTLNPSRDALFVPMLQNFFGCRINRVIAPKEFYLIKTIFDNILVSNLGCKTSAFLRGKEKARLWETIKLIFLLNQIKDEGIVDFSFSKKMN